MKLNFNFKLSPITLALAIAIPSAQAAQVLEEVVVTASPIVGDDSRVTAEELETSQAQDLNDIFRGQAEVAVGGSKSISQKIYVRGFEDTLLNVSIDGADQSANLFHHQGRLSIEPEIIKQVDVSAGAGRATDGPGALAGSVKFVTKDAHDLLKSGEQFGASVKAGYYTNNDGFKTSASLYGEITEGLGILAHYTQLNTDEIVDGNGSEHPYSDVEQHAGLVKLSGNLNAKHYLSLSYDFRNDDGERLNRPHFHPSFKNEPLMQEADRGTFVANHKLSHSELINLDTRLYSTTSHMAQLNHKKWGTSEGTQDTLGAKFSNTSHFVDQSLEYGFDYRQDKGKLESSMDKTHQEKGTVYGLFLQDDWQLTDSFVATFGARYDWYELNDDLGQEFKSNGFSPNVALTGKLTIT